MALELAKIAMREDTATKILHKDWNSKFLAVVGNDPLVQCCLLWKELGLCMFGLEPWAHSESTCSVGCMGVGPGTVHFCGIP